jgi:hypothetical protein
LLDQALPRIEHKLNIAKPAVQWLFLDLNAFFASCEQQKAPALRGKPVIVVQTMTDSDVAIAASYAAKAYARAAGACRDCVVKTRPRVAYFGRDGPRGRR